MLTSDLSITDYAQRRRVLGRRADIRLAQALRRPVRLHERLRRRIVKTIRARTQMIRQWQDGSFVEKIVTLPLPRTA